MFFSYGSLTYKLSLLLKLSHKNLADFHDILLDKMNLTKLIKIARRNGHRPSLLTNGLKLRREPYAQELKDAGLNLLGISMNGGLENDIYVDMDNGKYAKLKMEALENIFKVSLHYMSKYYWITDLHHRCF